ncbi:glycosyltransferase family 1 protein [Acinetobacter cumulans]|uniref:glycosyltransferase n=1 Tax=Acinetobacter cumulans TaxID=2136182 RepID=UPI000EA25C81|nr:glycosyltransferase [Acinetobacter cumulans]RKG48575.1 glycosyltransferase family 1 protein [Acinetobacter cumulans]
MKVLHAAETIKGGVATVMNTLIEYQINDTSIEKVLSLTPSDQINDLKKHTLLSSNYFKRQGRSILGMLNFSLSFMKILIKEKPDIVHLHSTFAGLIGRLIILITFNKKNTKVIYCPHAFSFLMSKNIFYKKIFAFIEVLLSYITDAIICVSKSEFMDAIQYKFPKNKLVIIHNGVKHKTEINQRNLCQIEKYKLLFVGRFDYQKGIDILFDAIKILNEKKFNFELSLVGDFVNNHNKNIEKIENVNFKGWLTPSELKEEYLTHDLIIIPSRWEGFAMVPLEAMSYGLPIIASDIKPFLEIITHNVTGIIFNKDDTESLVEKILNIDKYNLESIRKKALLNFNDNFEEFLMISKTRSLYN